MLPRQVVPSVHVEPRQQSRGEWLHGCCDGFAASSSIRSRTPSRVVSPMLMRLASSVPLSGGIGDTGPVLFQSSIHAPSSAAPCRFALTPAASVCPPRNTIPSCKFRSNEGTTVGPPSLAWFASHACSASMSMRGRCKAILSMTGSLPNNVDHGNATSTLSALSNGCEILDAVMIG